MNGYAFKAGVYIPITGLGMTKWKKAKIVDFFDKLECIPEDYDPENIDEEEALYFEEHLNKFHPRYIFTDNVNLWIVEYIMALDYDDPEDGKFAVAPSTIESIASTVVDKLDIIARPVVFSYKWYTGTNEPFVRPMEANMYPYDVNELKY